MAFSDNNPTFKYVKISGLNIIHEGISYRISEIYSSSKYFYWDKNRSPNELITSNIRIAESASVFLICMNDRGIHTEVNHDELIYNFGGYTSGGGGGDVSKTEFNALKVQVGENKEAYMNVSQSVDGIFQVIGDTEELKDGTIIKHINSLKHTSDSMDFKIQELNTKISDEYEELRDRCSDSLVDLLASISTLKIDFEHFAEEDEELTEEGKNTINTCIENTRGKLSTLKGVVDEILTILSDGERLDEHTNLNSAFNDMSTDVTNMLNLVSRSISDGGISSDDIINVILAIGTATQKLSVLKATVDEIMTLGLGGTIYDSYSQIHVDNERIKTTVKKTESIIYGALKSSSSEYYSSTSTTALEGGGWQDTPPAWQAGRYIWQRTKYTYASGQVSYSKPVCIAGAKGDRGEDGTSTKILGSYDTYEELIQAHPFDNEHGDGYLIKGELHVWTGTQFENVGQIKGDDGESAHLHIKYSNDGGQTFTGNNGEDTGLYIGVYSDFNAIDSNDVNDYTWSLIKGEDGKDGLNGIDGINGKDGVSIIWKGTFTSHPSGAENGWAYYNSTEGKSFVYQDNTWYQMSIDGTDGIKGNDGADGLSIVWKGEQKTPPSRPETNWVYRDTDNGIVYIYNGSAWEAMTYDGSDGTDGTNGTDGLSIIWKGEASTPPSNAEENWVYRDTDDGIIYIYTEGKWEIMAVDGIDGVDGTDGINGSSLLIFTTDYSSNQSTIKAWSKEGYKRNWVVKEDITNVQAGDNALIKVNNSTRKIDCFILVKVDSVNTSTSSINATSYGLVDKGEDGADGLSVFITYHDSVEKPDLPTGDGTTNGWHTDATDETRWMSQKVALSATEGTWGEPIKIKGEDGSSIKILGTHSSLEELLSKHPAGTNQNGDGYLINGELHVWNGDNFLNVGKVKGEDGEKGEDGTSMYLHVKYSNDEGKTFTGNNGEDEGTYIGTYADREEADSMDVTRYKWVKLTGQSLVKSTPQWYLSTSKTSQTGGSWTETMPELKDGYYLWLRYKLDWENPTQTTYSTPTIEQLYENFKEVKEKQATLEQDMDGFRTMVSETYATKTDVEDVEDYLSNNYTTTTEMKSMIDQSASQIKTSVSETYATKTTVNTVSSTANSALSTANTANTNATKAQTTANTANTNATNAQTTANTANTTATKAQSTANTANTNATNALNKANTNASNITTITTKQSSLEQTVNNFKTTVSDTYATKSELSSLGNNYVTKTEFNQTSEDFTFKVSQSGGVNLLRNSDFYEVTEGKYNYWTIWGGCSQYTTTSSLYQTYEGSMIISNQTTSTEGGLYQEVSGIRPNVEYTLSVNLSWASNAKRAYLAVEYYSSSGTKLSGITPSVVNNISTRQSFTFTTPSNCARIRVVFNHTGSTNGSSAYYIIQQPCLVEGYGAIWMPHSKELYDGIVKIDNNGLTVQHNNSKSVLDSEALKFYEGSIPYSKVKDGQLTYTNSAGNDVGRIGRNQWKNDNSIWVSHIGAEHKCDITIGAKNSSSQDYYPTNFVIAGGHHDVGTTAVFYDGVNIVYPTMASIVRFRPNIASYMDWDSNKESYRGDGEIFGWRDSNSLKCLGVSGRNKLILGTHPGSTSYEIFSIYTNSSGSSYIDAYAPLNMHGYSVANLTARNSLSARSTYSSTLMNSGTNEYLTHNSMSYGEGEVRWCWKETVFTYAECDVDPATDEWIYTGRNICYIELPIFMAENMQNDYHINVSKMSWGDYRIIEKTPYYFILESQEEDFAFTFEVVAKLRDGETTDSNAVVANGGMYEFSVEEEREGARVYLDDIQENIITGEE